MNKEQIIKLAQEAGLEFDDSCTLESTPIWYVTTDDLVHFADLVAAAEREQCAEFCENQYEFYGYDHVFAAGIRARGKR